MSKYLEGNSFKLVPELTTKNTLWIKPFFNAPFGFALWIGSMIRNIQIVTLTEYLTSQLKFHTKSYNVDFTPLKASKSHIFAKYDFKVTDKLTRINLRLKCTSDPYLLQYLRIKIIDKSKSIFQIESQTNLHTHHLENLSLNPTAEGYLVVIEGVMPYNTNEGQLQLEVATN